MHTYTMTYEDLIPTKEVAALKRVTVKTVNLWAQQGRLPIAATEKISGARLFDPEVVAAFNPKTSPVSASPEAAETGDPHDARRPVPDRAAGVSPVRRAS